MIDESLSLEPVQWNDPSECFLLFIDFCWEIESIDLNHEKEFCKLKKIIGINWYLYTEYSFESDQHFIYNLYKKNNFNESINNFISSPVGS